MSQRYPFYHPNGLCPPLLGIGIEVLRANGVCNEPDVFNPASRQKEATVVAFPYLRRGEVRMEG